MSDFDNAGPPLTVWVFPGASIMKFTRFSGGLVIVRCPGCGASLLYSTADPPTTFVHEDDDCPILRRIETALAMLVASTGIEWP